MSLFPKKQPPPSHPPLMQYMVKPVGNGYLELVPYLVPAINSTQVAVNEIKRLIERANTLEDGEHARFSVSTAFTDCDQITETHSISADISFGEQTIIFKRTRG